MSRIAGRFTRVEPRRRAGRLVLGLLMLLLAVKGAENLMVVRFGNGAGETLRFTRDVLGRATVRCADGGRRRCTPTTQPAG